MESEHDLVALLRTRFDEVAEQAGRLRQEAAEKLGQLDQHFEEVQGEIVGVREHLDSVDGRYYRTERRFDQLTGHLDLAMARFKEIDENKLDMPREPRTLYVLSGSGYEGGDVQEAYLRWVIYLPYATAESTGLTEKPGPNAPRLMDAGPAGAHIMITPPRN